LNSLSLPLSLFSSLPLSLTLSLSISLYLFFSDLCFYYWLIIGQQACKSIKWSFPPSLDVRKISCIHIFTSSKYDVLSIFTLFYSLILISR
jgi:hypothetical protein